MRGIGSLRVVIPLVASSCGSSGSSSNPSFGDGGGNIRDASADHSRDASKADVTNDHLDGSRSDGRGRRPFADAPTADAVAIDVSVPPVDAGDYYLSCSKCPTSCSGGCAAGACVPTVMTGHVVVNDRLTQDTSSLYWYGLEGDSSTAYAIERVAKTGGAVSTLTSLSDHPDAGFIVQEPVAGGFGSVFFSTTTSSGQAHVFAASVGGATREILTTDSQLFALAVDDAGLYASVSGQDAATVLSLAPDGGAPTTVYAVGASEPLVESISANGARFAWIEGALQPSRHVSLVSGSVTGAGSLQSLVDLTDAGNITGPDNLYLTTDAQYVYWMIGPQGNGAGPAVIRRTPLAGGASEVVVSDDGISGYTVDDTFLYWSAAHADGTGKFVYSQARVPKSGGSPVLISCLAAEALAVDGNAMYVAGATVIWKVTLP
jgi:hypothetical protein